MTSRSEQECPGLAFFLLKHSYSFIFAYLLKQNDENERCDQKRAEYLLRREILGLMVSYLHREDEKAFFERINQILTPRARLLIIDSLWNPKRSKYRNKEGVEERTLNDGRKFKVYKRYLDKADIARTFKANGFAIKSVYLGDMLFAATATRA